MKNILLLFICSFALFNPIKIWALRIKRDGELNSNHYKIKQDFVKLSTEKNDFEKELNTDRNASIGIMNANTTYNPKNFYYHSLNSTKKRGIISPLANKPREREPKLNERHAENQMIPLIHAKNFAGEKTCLAKSKIAKRNDSTISKHNRIGYLSQKLPLATGSDNIFRTRVMMPPQPIQPLTPIDQIMKFANMLMFKVGMDSMSPYDEQSSQMAYSPNMLMALNSHNQQHFHNDIDPGLEFLINSIDGPQANSLLTGLANNIKQIRTIVYEPPSIFKQSITADEPKQFIDLIQNTLDTVLSKTNGESDGEIEVHCPIHHGKKSFEAEDKCASDEIGEQEKDNNSGVIQVCSCRFIKHTKKNIDKEAKKQDETK